MFATSPACMLAQQMCLQIKAVNVMKRVLQLHFTWWCDMDMDPVSLTEGDVMIFGISRDPSCLLCHQLAC